jgi:hypothetical protein
MRLGNRTPNQVGTNCCLKEIPPIDALKLGGVGQLQAPQISANSTKPLAPRAMRGKSSQCVGITASSQNNDFIGIFTIPIAAGCSQQSELTGDTTSGEAAPASAADIDAGEDAGEQDGGADATDPSNPANKK